MKKVIGFGLVAAAAIALTGCTDSDAAPSNEGGGELRQVRVAALAHHRDRRALGRQQGGHLRRARTPGRGGARPGRRAGDSRPDQRRHRLRDRPALRPVPGGPAGSRRRTSSATTRPPTPTGDDINAVVASAKSGITRPAELAGRRVAVNSLGAAGDVTIMAAVEKDGGDPSTIKFVEVAFPDAPAQLEAGNIDAAWVPEPFVTQLRRPRRHLRRRALPGDRAWPGDPDHDRDQEADGVRRRPGRGLLRGDEGDARVGEGSGQRGGRCASPSRTT